MVVPAVIHFLLFLLVFDSPLRGNWLTNAPPPPSRGLQEPEAKTRKRTCVLNVSLALVPAEHWVATEACLDPRTRRPRDPRTPSRGRDGGVGGQRGDQPPPPSVDITGAHRRPAFRARRHQSPGIQWGGGLFYFFSPTERRLGVSAAPEEFTPTAFLCFCSCLCGSQRVCGGGGGGAMVVAWCPQYHAHPVHKTVQLLTIGVTFTDQ